MSLSPLRARGMNAAEAYAHYRPILDREMDNLRKAKDKRDLELLVDAITHIQACAIGLRSIAEEALAKKGKK